MRFRVPALVLLCVPAACAPIVTHGPRPEPGVQVMATLGIPQELCDSGCEVELIPQLGFGVRSGRPAENGNFGYSVTGTFSASILATEADLYVQAPTAPEWAAGGGVLLSFAHVMPYVQLGRMRADGSGFYTTQGFALLTQRTNFSFTGRDNFLITPRYWAPTVAYRFAHRDGAVHVYLSGAFGSAGADDGGLPPEIPSRGSVPIRQVMAGVTVEHFVRRPPPLAPARSTP